MLHCDEGFSVPGSVLKIFKLGKLNMFRWISLRVPFMEMLYTTYACSYSWISQKKLIEYCFTVNYNILIFINATSWLSLVAIFSNVKLSCCANPKKRGGKSSFKYQCITAKTQIKKKHSSGPNSRWWWFKSILQLVQIITFVP